MCSRQKHNIEEKRKTTQTPQNWLLAPAGLHFHRWAPVSPLTSESHPTLVCSKQSYMHTSQLPWWRWPWGHQHCRGQWPGTGSVAAGAAPSFPGSCTSSERPEETWLLTEAFHAHKQNVRHFEGLTQTRYDSCENKAFLDMKRPFIPSSPLHTEPFFLPLSTL